VRGKKVGKAVTTSSESNNKEEGVKGLKKSGKDNGY
jgi:hypothetical protein